MNTEITLSKISLLTQFTGSYMPRGAGPSSGVDVLGVAGNAVVKPALTRTAFIPAPAKVDAEH